MLSIINSVNWWPIKNEDWVLATVLCFPTLHLPNNHNLQNSQWLNSDHEHTVHWKSRDMPLSCFLPCGTSFLLVLMAALCFHLLMVYAIRSDLSAHFLYSRRPHSGSLFPPAPAKMKSPALLPCQGFLHPTMDYLCPRLNILLLMKKKKKKPMLHSVPSIITLPLLSIVCQGTQVQIGSHIPIQTVSWPPLLLLRALIKIGFLILSL